MANEFVTRNGFISLDNSTISGSLDVSGSGRFRNNLNVSGSLFISGTTQSAGNGNVLTYDTTTGQVFFTASSAVGAGSVDVSQFVPNSQTSSFVRNTQTSSFVTNSQTSSFVTNNQTASFVTNSQTSSFVLNSQTSSFVTNSQTSSFVTNSQTSSFVLNSQTSSMTVLSSSFASTASFVPGYVPNSQTSSFVTNNQTSSFVTNNQTSSFVTNSQTSSFVLNAQTGSFATTGSNTFRGDQFISGTVFISGAAASSGNGNVLTYDTTTGKITYTASSAVGAGSVDVSQFVPNSQTGSFVTNSQTSSFVTNTQTSSFVLNSQTSSFVTNTQTSSFVTNSQTSSFVTNSQTSSFVTNSQTSSFVTNSQTSSFVLNNQTASFATTGSNTFRGNQTISGSLFLSGAAVSNTGFVLTYNTTTGQIGYTSSAGLGGSSTGLVTYASQISNTSFNGTPLTASVTFTTPFTDNNYAISIEGDDSRTWTVQSKTTSGFTINSNSSIALTGPVYWIAIQSGSGTSGGGGGGGSTTPGGNSGEIQYNNAGVFGGVPALTYNGSNVIATSLVATGTLQGTASYASNSDLLDGIDSTRFATTGSNTFTNNQIISGSLTITNDLTVLGSASVQYVTSSTLNIGTNLITVNTFNPTNRFGGLAIIDSGSSPLVSGSILYDSVQDEFVFVHKGNGTNITSSLFLQGPETIDNLGSEIYLTANRIPKSKGNEHLNDSNITDTGTIVSINSNTEVTGSLSVSGSLALRFVTASATYTASIADSTIDLTGNVTASLYTVVGNRGRQLYIKNGGTGIVTVDANTTETIDGRLTRRLGAAESLLLQSDGVSDWTLLNKNQYVCQFAHDWTTGTPLDSTTYYIGNFMAQNPSSTAAATRRVIAMASGWATYVTLMVSVAGVVGTSEDSTLVLANVTTGQTTTITTTLEHNTAAQLLTFTLATPLQITKGDSLEMRWTTPNWGTNPEAVRQVAQVLIN